MGNREDSQGSNRNDDISNDSFPITPVTDHSSSVNPTVSSEEADDDLHSLPSPGKAEKPQIKLWRRASPGSTSGLNGSQSRRTTVSSILGNDWAISPNAEISNGKPQRPSIVHASRQSSISSNNASNRQTSIKQSSSRGGSIFSVLPFFRIFEPVKL